MNSVVLAGNLGRDAELKYFDNGSAVSKTTLAVNKTYVKDGEKVQRTEWVNISIYGKRGEGLNQYLTKGTFIVVQGELRSFTVGDGDDKKYFTEVAVNELTFGGGGNNSGEKSSGGGKGNGGGGRSNSRSKSNDNSEDAPW